MSAQRRGEHLEVPLTWVGMEEVPVLFVNQMMAQVDDKAEVLLTLGQATPPALLGSPEQVRAQAERLAYVPVKPVARFNLSRTRVLELIAVLQKVLEIQSNTRAAIRQAGQGENL